MKKLKSLIVLIASLVLVLSSCKKDEPIPEEEGNSTPVEIPVGSLNLGSNVTADFFGTVLDESNQAVANATIIVGNKSASTDANGNFLIIDAAVPQELAHIKVEKTGYFFGSKSVIPSTSATSCVKITLLELSTSSTVSSGVESTVATDGAKVVLPGDFVNIDGTTYNGSVNVSMKFIPTMDMAELDKMPGSLYGENIAGDDIVLENYGTVAIELRGTSGQELQLKLGSPATIHIPINSQQLNDAPSTLPLWFFDETNGYWIEEGEAQRVGDEYIGSVSHFSFWTNCTSWDKCLVQGLLTDEFQNPVPLAQIMVSTVYGNRTGYTDANGYFAGRVPKDQALNLSIMDACGDNILNTNLGPYQSYVNTVFLQGTVSGLNYLHIVGNANDCSSSSIQNGIIEIQANGTSYYYPFDNGVINLLVPACIATSSVDIFITDYNSFEQGSALNVPIVSNEANFGTITACQVIPTELATWKVDGWDHAIDTSITLVVGVPCAGDPVLNFGFFYHDDTPIFTFLLHFDGVGTFPLINDTPLLCSDQVADCPIDLPYNMHQATTPHNVSIVVTNYPTNPGDFLDMNWNGTFYDWTNVAHTVEGNFHVRLDP